MVRCCTAPGSAGHADGSGSPRAVVRDRSACIATFARRRRSPPRGRGTGRPRSVMSHQTVPPLWVLLQISVLCVLRTAESVRLWTVHGQFALSHHRVNSDSCRLKCTVAVSAASAHAAAGADAVVIAYYVGVSLSRCIPSFGGSWLDFTRSILVSRCSTKSTPSAKQESHPGTRV